MINDIIVALIVIGLVWAAVMFAQSVIGLIREFVAYRRQQSQAKKQEGK